MIQFIAKTLNNNLIKNGVISADLSSVYIYGFEVLISGLFGITICLALGAVFSKLLETLIFLTIFVILRSYTGGYHADTYLRCNIIFSILFVSILCMSEFLPHGIILHYTFDIISIIIAAFLAPVENANKPLTEAQKKKLRLIATFICVASVVISSVVYTRSPKLRTCLHKLETLQNSL
jgi:accessory gene regulator B